MAVTWQDQGLVLRAAPFGEGGLIATAFTREHGKARGLARGGSAKRQRPWWQAGNLLDLTWQARLAEQLGQFSAEPATLFAGLVLADAARLAALASVTALLDSTLAEGDPHPGLFEVSVALLTDLPRDPAWPFLYVRFEALLLAELGFGLDLSRCAVTGATGGLAYVSPRTGRAVTREAAGDYAERLLPLPPFLTGQGPEDAEALQQALRLTGHFLARQVYPAIDRPVPAARQRLLDRLMSFMA